MIKIRRKKKRSVPGLNMASMPDLIFTVLFFFMIVTHMRTETVQVKYDVPSGTEVSQAKKKYANVNIYIGKDSNGETRIQVNDNIVSLYQVGTAINKFRSNLSPADNESMTVTLRADRGTPMGIINDVKKELRRAGALSIRYSAAEDKENINKNN